MTTEPTPPVERVRPGLDRLSSLSDGVFAVGLTLLVLPLTDIRISDARLGPDLLALGPPFFAFLLSFLVIGRFWLVHHDDVGDLVAVDGRLLRANLLFLFFVVLLPFPTAMIGEGGGKAATAIYALVLIATALSSILLRRTAARGGLLRPGRTRAPDHAGWALVAGFAPSLALVAVSASAAQLSWLLAVPLAAVARRRAHRAPRTP